MPDPPARPRALTACGQRRRPTKPIARNSPATGLPSGQRKAKSSASFLRPRWSASTDASPNTVPIANGSRLVNSRVAVPAPNQIAPQRAALRAEVPVDDRLEERRGGQRADHERQLRAEQPCQRRREHAVGGGVMPAVPVPVPDREALAPEQVGAEEVGRQVDRARREDQVDASPRSRRPARGRHATRGRVATSSGGRPASAVRSTRRGAVAPPPAAAPSAAPLPRRKRRAARRRRLSCQKATGAIDQVRAVEPHPVPAILHHLELRVAERLRVALAELGR